MRNYIIITLVLGIGLSSAFGISGDMGLGMDPLIDGSAEHPFLIEDIADFNNFSNDPNYWAVGAYTRLDTDIDLSGRVYERAVIAPYFGSSSYGFFSGVFDGNGHVISNLTIDADNGFLGLFGYIEGANAVVKNLGIEDVNITGGSYAIGGLCGANGDNRSPSDGGSIINCYSTGTITGEDRVGGLCGLNYKGIISNCYSSIKVTGSSNSGGLVGELSLGKISGCHSSGVVDGGIYTGGFCGGFYRTDINNCHSTVLVSGGGYTGGFAGEMIKSSINNCYSTGTVSGNGKTGGFCGISGGYYEDAGCDVMNCYSTGAVIGGDEVGGFCGSNEEGEISNCYSTSSVTGNRNVGGFCGKSYHHSNISNSYSTGAVIGGDEAGGFCGFNEVGTISNCYSTGAVNGDRYVGGFCGENFRDSSINNCFWDVESSGISEDGDDNEGATGKTTAEMQTVSTFTDAGWDFYGIDANEPNWVMLFGHYPKLIWELPIVIEGELELYLKPGESGTVDVNIYSRVDEVLQWSIGADERFGWIAGIEPDNGVLAGLGDMETVTIDIDTTTMEAGIYKGGIIFFVNGEQVVMIPVKLNVLLQGEGTLEDPYLIECLSGFDVFSDQANAERYWASGVHTKLCCDIDLAGRIYEKAVIGPGEPTVEGYDGGIPYQGIFDGSGHVVRNLMIDAKYPEGSYYNGNLGLFGHISDANAVVKNLGVEDGNIICGDESTYNVGLLCAKNSSYRQYNSYYGGSIINCYTTGSITGGDSTYNVGGLCGYNNRGFISNCYSTCSVVGNSRVGGFCGYNLSDSSINNCYSTGAVFGLDNSRYIGGFCGWNRGGNISNCYSIGEIAAGENSAHIGGFCGHNYGLISYCFWDVQTSGMGESDGGVGLPTLVMQNYYTYEINGWDFVNDWWINDYRDYPKLAWQPFGDLNNDSHVDMRDIAMMGLAWMSSVGDINFNSVCELSGDWTIDADDLAEIGVMWLAGPEPQNNQDFYREIEPGLLYLLESQK